MPASTEQPSRPLTWSLFLEEMLPSMLDEVGITGAVVAKVVQELGSRADDYAAGGRAARRALRAPFLDDVAQFDPPEAPIGSRADIAVVIRNAPTIEHEHAKGAIEDSTLFKLTYFGCAAFNVWLNQHANREEDSPPAGVFADVANFSRAYAALQAAAIAAEAGGRVPFALAKAALPELPAVGEGSTLLESGKIVRSGASDIDADLADHLSRVVAGEVGVLFTSSLSRYSRDSVLLAHVMEVVLAHDATLLTTNLMIRAGEAFARKPPFIGANSHEPFADADDRGLTGVHRKVFARFGAANGE